MSRLSLVILCLAFAMPASAKERFQQPGPVHLDKKGEKWARESLKKMSLEQKIGQMFMIWARADFMNIASPEYTVLRDAMRKYHIGGFGITVSFEDGLLSKTPPLETAMLTNQLQHDSEFPLIFAADFERGLAFRLEEVTNFPHAMAFGATGDPEFAREAGRITAREARAIGVQWNWFPDADVNSNPENPGDQYALFWRGSHPCEQDGDGLHRGRARVRDADYGQAFSRTRRYGCRFAPSRSVRSREIRRIWRVSSSRRSRQPLRREWTR